MIQWAKQRESPAALANLSKISTRYPSNITSHASTRTQAWKAGPSR
jgi:hypothetical protein